MKEELWRILGQRYLLGKILLAAFLFVASVYLFASIADEVVEGDTLAYDRWVLQAIHQAFSPQFDQLFVIGTQFGGTVAVIIAGAVGVGILLYLRRWRQAVFLASSMGGALLVSTVLKLLFARARPDLWQQLIAEATSSFPSGHAIASSVIVFSLAFLLWNTKWRVAVLCAGFAYMVFIGFSRLYLGVHYPTDILAGWCVSLAWVITVQAIIFTVRRGRRG